MPPFDRLVDRGDNDLLGTRIGGSRSLIEAVKNHPALETVDWSGQLG